MKSLSETELKKLEFILKEKETFLETADEKVVMKFMKFLVCTNSWEFLFSTFYEVTVSLGTNMRNEFLQALLPFIEMRMITQMPSSKVFTDLVTAAESEQSPPIVPMAAVHKLILNLDLTQQNFSFILTICKHKEAMFTPYTYLVTRIDSDFLKPL